MRLPLLIPMVTTLLAAPLAAQDSTMTMNDVSYARHIQVEGHDLVLNGMALRKKVVFKVYVAGLYLPARSSNAEQILGADSPRRIVLQFLRDVDAKRMCGAWDEALENNTPNASAALKQQFVTLCGYMEDIEKGQQFVFTYLPGSGTRIEVNGKNKGTLEGKDFADALFKAWLGPKPGPGEDFKKKLLGLAS
ncbi:MAG: chalcone isomerase family protein [Gemmatimonadota bacterium]